MYTHTEKRTKDSWRKEPKLDLPPSGNTVFNFLQSTNAFFIQQQHSERLRFISDRFRDIVSLQNKQHTQNTPKPHK